MSGGTPASSTAVAFPLLADPASYQPGTIDLVNDAGARQVWLDIFESHCRGLVRLAARSEGDVREAQRRAGRFGRQFRQILQDYRRGDWPQGPPSVLRFCTLREELLRRHGFADPYSAIKRRENDAALALLPTVLREIDAVPAEQRLAALVENIFAGNLFDLGCAGTIEMYESGQAEFRAARRRLPARPWSVDDLEAATRRFATLPAHRCAIVFVDNAGGDVVLGMIPLARWLLQRGTQVVLAANSTPALNDITHDELKEVMASAAGHDPDLASGWKAGRLRLVASGNGVPLIDLRCVSRELAGESAGADLLVLEGMGRALETNYRARFTVDTLKLATVKEPHVAQTLGTRLYEPVCRFEPAPAAGAGDAS